MREQAAEAERKALSYQEDGKRLKEEAENQKEVLEDRTSRISIARKESTQLAERVRNTVEETVRGDPVKLLSLCTPRASDRVRCLFVSAASDWAMGHENLLRDRCSFRDDH